MAFWKSLFRRKNTPSSASVTNLTSNLAGKVRTDGTLHQPAEAFLVQLEQVLDLFLKEQIHKGDAAFPESMRAVGVLAGTFQGGTARNTMTRRKANDKPYLFLRVPGQPGYLLETADDQKMWLTRATMVQPLQTNASGDVTRPLMFVAQLPSPLETFHFLDAETVRSSQGRTSTLEQFAEMLLTLAYENLREPVQN